MPPRKRPRAVQQQRVPTRRTLEQQKQESMFARECRSLQLLRISIAVVLGKDPDNATAWTWADLNAAIVKWAVLGFPGGLKARTAVRDALDSTLKWIFPQGYSAGREAREAWNFAFLASMVLTLDRVRRLHHVKHHLRVVLRACLPSVQKCLLYNDFRSRSWATFLESVPHLTNHPHTKGNVTSLNYVFVTHRHRVWYTGKANLV